MSKASKAQILGLAFPQTEEICKVIYTNDTGICTIQIFDKNNKMLSQKIVQKLEELDLDNWKLICSAYSNSHSMGRGFRHCFSLANNHTENFINRVAGYHIHAPTQDDCSFAISFYEKLSQ